MAKTASVGPQVAIDIRIERWPIERLIPRAPYACSRVCEIR
jgi:hypothetical protein